MQIGKQRILKSIPRQNRSNDVTRQDKTAEYQGSPTYTTKTAKKLKKEVINGKHISTGTKETGYIEDKSIKTKRQAW